MEEHLPKKNADFWFFLVPILLKIKRILDFEKTELFCVIMTRQHGRLCFVLFKGEHVTRVNIFN